MKITEVKTYLMAAPGRPWLFVKLLTDEGLYGWGEATLEMRVLTVRACVHELADQFLIGQDPTRPDYLWQIMYRHAFWRGGVAILSAISGIEQALWDITGRAYGQPVYRLLGGAVRDHIPAYTHCGNPESAVGLVEHGWRALKTGPGGVLPGTRNVVTERSIERSAAQHLEALREAVGEDVELMVDNHGRLRPSAAIRVGRAIEPYRLLFFEEPVPPDNVAALETVRRAGLSMDLATGERLFTKWGYRELLERQLVDVIQPDVCHVGGIKELLKIAAMAETYYVQVAPHNPNGPVATAASVHAAACMPNLLLLEYASAQPQRDEVQSGIAIRATDGSVPLPTAPGLGIELDEEYIAAHPYEPRPTRGLFYPDGSVADV